MTIASHTVPHEKFIEMMDRCDRATLALNYVEAIVELCIRGLENRNTPPALEIAALYGALHLIDHSSAN